MSEIEAHKRPLSDADQARVWAAIGRAMTSGDARPGDVINNRFDGCIPWYLRTMAEWHGVPIEGSSTPPKNVPKPASYASSTSPTA